jgi:hypothetical protein
MNMSLRYSATSTRHTYVVVCFGGGAYIFIPIVETLADDYPQVFVLIRGVLQGGTAVRGQHPPRYVIFYLLYPEG